MQPYEFFIGLRYTRAKRRNHFISFISLISMLGIALGVAALIIVLSVMSGFQKDIRAHILGVTSHLQVGEIQDRLTDWPQVAQRMGENPQVLATAPYIAGQGMLALSDSVQGVMVRGILPEQESRVEDLASKMKVGKLDDLRAGEFGIVLGSDLAYALRTGVGKKVLLITPQGQITPAGMVPRLKQFTVVGIFEVGMAPYDNALALIHLSDAQKLYRMDDAVTGVGARLKDIDRAPETAAEIQQTLPDNLYATDWTRQNAAYFSVVAMEKRMMFIILSLIVLVAAFNIVSTLAMAVTDKQADIAILRTLGASPASIMKIFMVQGVLIRLIGVPLGVLGGLLVALNIGTLVPFIEHLMGKSLVPKEFYFLGELPSDL
ncbi:MAG: lipoprotein-releasing ABC transporter permease subunit, partial [Gallionellaceae bacterium]|nr:lipoprotein-releasing ABC transporter permease subunit [Gallionellaceae bacterium]